jgi:FkbM family methyltransferase
MKLKPLTISFTLTIGRLVVRPLVGFRRLLGLPLIKDVTRRGIHYRLDLREGIDSSIYLKGDFEKDVRLAIENETKKGMIVLDIGANVGGHTLDFAKNVGPQGKVYAFEPTDYAYKKLLTNCSLNPTFSIIPLQIGLTDHLNTALPEHISSSWDLTKNPKEANKLDFGFAHSIKNARQLSLDQWVDENQINQIDLVKIDVDGHETKVLRGAIQTLLKFKPKIILEFAPHHFTHPTERFEDMVEILVNLGYRFTTLDGKPITSNALEIIKSIPWGVLLYVLAI